MDSPPVAGELQGLPTEPAPGGGMGGGAEEEGRARVVPCLDSLPDSQLHEMALLPIPDELLAEILLRLPTLADLVRASAAYVSFRRVATDRSFLRRFRKLHAPPLLGFLDHHRAQNFLPAAPPHPSAPAASAVALAADFSFSFLPAPAHKWRVQDVRDGRVLLSRPMPVHNSTFVFPEVVVCDPLHRQSLPLSPVTDDLAASMKDAILTNDNQVLIEIFLVPTGDGEEAATVDETSFRVIWMAQCKTMLVAFVFSSNTGQWRAVPSWRWTDLSACLPGLIGNILFYGRQYVYGCFYRVTVHDDFEECKLLVLDIKTMEFSVAKPPPEANNCGDYAMVEAGDGRPGMFVLEESSCDINYFIRQNDGRNSSQWKKVKTISLDYTDHLICTMENHLLLYQKKISEEEQIPEEAGGFALDIETFQLEKVCALGCYLSKLHAYRNFPPSLLSSPTISSGVEKGPEKEMLEQGCALSSSTESPRPSD